MRTTMRRKKRARALVRGAAAFATAAAVAFAAPVAAAAPGGGHEEEGFGNNLAMPVLWSETSDAGARPELRGDGSQSADLTLDPTAFENVDGSKVFLQRTENTWQSENSDAADSGVALTDDGKIPVSFVDWGDNIEVRDPMHPHMLRVETRLLQDVSGLTDADPADGADANGMTGYSMLKTNDITGVGEMWGVQSTTAAAEDQAVAVQTDEAFVYTSQACLTIEKIDAADSVSWNPATRSWTDASAIAKCVGEVTEGPGGYGAEVTISGGMTYGYVWRVPDYPAGLYRLTFSLKEESGADFTDATTLYTSEESEEPGETPDAALSAEDGEEEEGGPIGNVAVIDPANNLSYIDIGIDYTSGKPTRPVNLTATRDVDATTLAWDPPVDEGSSALTRYQVTGSGPAGSVPEQQIDATQPLTATFDGLVGGDEYTFDVAAVNAEGVGASTSISVVPKVAPPPPAPTPSVSPTVPTTPPQADPPGDTPVTAKKQKRAQRRVSLRVRTKLLKQGKLIRVKATGRVRTKDDGKWIPDRAKVRIYFNPAGPAKARVIKRVRATAANGYTARFKVRKSGAVYAKVLQDAKHKQDRSRVVKFRVAR